MQINVILSLFFNDGIVRAQRTDHAAVFCAAACGDRNKPSSDHSLMETDRGPRA